MRGIPSSNKALLNLTTTPSLHPEYMLLLESILGNLTRDGYHPQLETYNKMLQLLHFLVSKYPAKVISALNILGFTGVHELRKLLFLDCNSHLDRTMMTLEKYGFINPLSSKSLDYEIKLRFWKNEHPNTRNLDTLRNIKLFEVEDSLHHMIELFYESICNRFITQKELNLLHSRKNRYENFARVVHAQLNDNENFQDKVIGLCHNCNKRITSNMVRGKDYSIFKVGYICHQCYNRASAQKDGLVLQWLKGC